MEKEVALTLQDVCVRYLIKDSWSRKKRSFDVVEAVKGVSAEIYNGEIVGVIGRNGSGKSTLLRAVAGIFDADEGVIDRHDHSVTLMSIGVGFHNDLSGRENIMLSGLLFGYGRKEIEERTDEIIEFSELGDFIDYPVRTYSSGMHSKLAFSISSVLESDIILVDEVLGVGDQHFKKKSYARLMEMINDKKHTVLIVSHTVSRLAKLCDRIMWLENGKIRKIGDPKEIIQEYLTEEGIEEEF